MTRRPSMRGMKLYIYKGPVFDQFGNVIDSYHEAETYAPSKEKAITNIKYRYRQTYSLERFVRLELDENCIAEK